MGSAGLPADIHHYRESRGIEVDIVLAGGEGPLYVEAKSGATLSSSFFEPLRRIAEATGGRAMLVYGGTEKQVRTGVHAIPWHQIHSTDWRI